MSATHRTGLRPMASADLEQVLEWRNHESVRKYMYTQHQIGLQEHTQWFERASKSPERHLLIYEKEEVALGFINVHVIADGGIADWGFYASPDAPKGTGRDLGDATLRYVFSSLDCISSVGRRLALTTVRSNFIKVWASTKREFCASNILTARPITMWCVLASSPENGKQESERD